MEVLIVWSYDENGGALFEGVFSKRSLALTVAQDVANATRRGVNIAPAKMDERIPDRSTWPDVDTVWPEKEKE